MNRLAEAGCTVHEIASISGHKDLREVQHYTEKFDRERLSRQAMAALTRSNHEQEVSRSAIPLDKMAS
jgi:hypothetical protein